MKKKNNLNKNLSYMQTKKKLLNKPKCTKG